MQRRISIYPFLCSALRDGPSPVRLGYSSGLFPVCSRVLVAYKLCRCMYHHLVTRKMVGDRKKFV